MRHSTSLEKSLPFASSKGMQEKPVLSDLSILPRPEGLAVFATSLGHFAATAVI
jgi:hypothetical protein